jgi:hypothetical protein
LAENEWANVVLAMQSVKKSHPRGDPYKTHM